MIARNVELTARLIDDFLDVTRIRLGKLGMAIEIADAHELLQSALGIWTNEIADKNLAIGTRSSGVRILPPSGFWLVVTGLLELAEKCREIYPARR